MNSLIESAFLDELEKISNASAAPSTGWKGFRHGALGEVGPALGATLGAGLAGAKGANPLSGAALGYGVGSLPEILSNIIKKRRGL